MSASLDRPTRPAPDFTTGASAARVDKADGLDFGPFTARDFTTDAGAAAVRAVEPFGAAPFAADPFAADPFEADPFAAEALAAGLIDGPPFEPASRGVSVARPPDPEAIAIVFLLILSKVLSTAPKKRSCVLYGQHRRPSTGLAPIRARHRLREMISFWMSLVPS